MKISSKESQVDEIESPSCLSFMNMEAIDQHSKIDEKIGPVYFKGKSPFNTRVVIVTNLTGPIDLNGTGRFITYVGFRKENEFEYDFDEMIPSESWKEAIQTHEKTCRFFMNSALFIETDNK